MVRSNIWKKATILAAILAGLVVRALLADPPATNPATTAPSVLDQSLTTLTDNAADQEVRDNAARKLVIGHDASLKPKLINILQNDGDRNGQLAIARALAQDARPDPDFVEPLFALLQTGHEATHIPAAQALAQYKTDAVLSRLVDIAGAVNQSEDLRLAVIPAIGTFDQKQAAQTLIGLQAGDDEAIKTAAGDALMNMTGLDEYGHDVQHWKNWWEQHASQADADFKADILRGRGMAFERIVVRRARLEDTVAKLLTDLYTQAPADQKDGIVIEYLNSPSEEVRALGANIISSSISSGTAVSPRAMQEARLLLGDSSAMVRAAAANALLNDHASADAMVAQLDRETDDNVRIQSIKSLAPLNDKRALEQMVKLVAPDVAMDVRLAAANGISRQGDLIVNGGADLKDKAYNALLASFQSTDAMGPPGVQALREAIIKAMAAIADPRLLGDLQKIISNQSESTNARINGLQGLGNLKDPNTGDFIANYLNDDNAGIRRAAVQALGTVPQPIYDGKLLDRMLNDRDQSVREQAWEVLQSWMTRINEQDLAILADDLKQQHDAAKQLMALRVLRDQLSKDVQTMTGDQKQKKEEDLATQEQNIGEVLMALKQPPPPDPANAAEAATQYHAALDFFKANKGTSANVIDTLCGDVVRAHLAAKQWDDAAKFAAATIAEYNDPTMKFIQEDVSKEFQLTAEGLRDSSAPDAGTDADALFAAIGKMTPPLPDSYQQQLAEIKQQIQTKKAQGGTP